MLTSAFFFFLYFFDIEKFIVYKWETNLDRILALKKNKGFY